MACSVVMARIIFDSDSLGWRTGLVTHRAGAIQDSLGGGAVTTGKGLGEDPVGNGKCQGKSDACFHIQFDAKQQRCSRVMPNDDAQPQPLESG